ncbi:NB-ARC domain-containing protein [Streptomyces noursei]|uniref:NB-ARC domain-containing protein n=1 Tax=Streptomyces noursei TaxID=1971 RepID=UPI00199469D2|nr:NB-ARC domain-containing protein [Streptomyces noursei]MCZ1014867.1 tetratricopeptide repeat protein [Streptomyces noursei]GGX53292.1 NTPase [Streptomyces noursei]
MDPVTVQELLSALTEAAGERAWQELAHLVLPPGPSPVPPDSPPGGPDTLSRLVAEARRVPHDPDHLHLLAARLAEEAWSSPPFARDLRAWLARTGPPVSFDAVNTIGGSAQLTGPTLQSREVHGGVHFHQVTVPSTESRLPVPRQLLPGPPHFTGRENDLAALDGLLAEKRPAGTPFVVVVSGSAGVGKTALASRWLGRLSEGGAFPDGQLYVDLRGHSPDAPARPGEVLGQFLRAYGIDRIPAALAEQAALWRSATAGLRVAVMLDNALSAAQVRPLLTGAAGGLVVVTSRRRLTSLGVDGAAFHQLGLLEGASAVELLARRIGIRRVDRERAEAREVAALCAGLPLALCLAAARLAARPQQSLAAMVGTLGADGGALAALRAEGERAVRTVLDESYRALPPDAARAYRCLGLAPVVMFDKRVAACACGLSSEEIGPLLDELVENNLVEDLPTDRIDGAERFRMHDLVRAHADETAAVADSPDERQAVVRRITDLYLATATAAEALLTPSHRRLRRTYACEPEPPPAFDDEAAALGWLDTERSHLMAMVRGAAERGWDPTAWQLVDGMFPLFLRLRPYDLWIEAHEIGLAAARRDGDREGVSRMLTSGGVGLRNAGHHDTAVEWFAQALDEARDSGDRRAEAQALHGLGQSHLLAGREERAAFHFTGALALREEIGHHRGAALTRLSLGDLALAAGRPADAIEPLTRAREELLAQHDPYDAARALALLGRAHSQVPGDHALATRLLDQALGEFTATGSVHWQARVWEFLGQAAEEHGNAPRARDCYQRSLALYEPVSERDARRLRARLPAAGTDCG